MLSKDIFIPAERDTIHLFRLMNYVSLQVYVLAWIEFYFLKIPWVGPDRPTAVEPQYFGALGHSI